MARQFATGKEVVVIRNGWFSYRWSVAVLHSLPVGKWGWKGRYRKKSVGDPADQGLDS